MTITYKLSEIDSVAKTLITKFKHKTILFDAKMGMGKTTLIKALCKQLGVKDVTGSPTFSLVNEYQGSLNTIYHFDLYRIEDSDELYDIGFEDYLLEDNTYIFIEWPEHARVFLDEALHRINLTAIDSNTRELTLS